MSNIINLTTEEEFNDFLEKNERNVVIVHFGAEWAPQCKQITDILCEAKGKSVNTSIVYIEAEKLPTVTLRYKVSVVPTLVFIKRKQVTQTIKGGNPRDLLKALNEMLTSSSQDTSLEDQIKTLINSRNVMLFMKGSPELPQCGFSRSIVKMLVDSGVEFGSFDILTNNEIREGLKKYSNWPTYPQLYINGELVGGVDIVQELVQSGDLQQMVMDAKTDKKERLNERLRGLINMEKVVLFMKGSPDTPKCGFSRKTVEILKRAQVKFGHFDILSDNDVREGLKELSEWPTYPQLYVKGELIGGFDIIKEMDELGDMASLTAE